MRLDASRDLMRDAAPRFLDAGDSGLVVELGNDISEATNRAVVALAAAVEARALTGIREIVPTYRSLLIQFDPLRLDRRDLVNAVQALWPPPETATTKRRLWRVPVLYGGEAGIDLAEVAKIHGLAEDEVIRLHSGAEYRVYMIGFAPGFAYLGGLPEALHTGRRADPRPTTPPGSISIGGAQAAVSPPFPVPSGWHLLGRTPLHSYDPRRSDRPVLFSSGDLVRFVPILRADYERLGAAAEAGEEIVSPEEVE